jgi:HPt (histidine-containing phosphotransfer) domain-containing protein
VKKTGHAIHRYFNSDTDKLYKRRFTGVTVPNQKWLQQAETIGIQSIDLADIVTLDELDSSGELLDEVIDLYLQTTPDLIASMSASAQQRESLAINHSAHTLKSSSANLGAKALASILQTIEINTSTAIDFDQIVKLIESADLEFLNIRTDLQNIKQFRKSAA